MKLTEKEIESLYKFTRQHYVEHYDVQTELVDHLANDIEAIWAEKPKLSFIQARDISFKKFGVFGFMDIVESRQKAMSKRYRKILWSFTKQWFSLPKAAITLLIFLSFLVLFKLPHSHYIILGILIFLAGFEIIKSFGAKRKLKTKKAKNEKIFLLEAMIKQTRAGFSAMIFVNLFNFVNITNIEFQYLAFHWQIISSGLLTLLCTVCYVITYVIPERAEELLEQNYPEYKLSKKV